MSERLARFADVAASAGDAARADHLAWTWWPMNDVRAALLERW